MTVRGVVVATVLVFLMKKPTGSAANCNPQDPGTASVLYAVR